VPANAHTTPQLRKGVEEKNKLLRQLAASGGGGSSTSSSSLAPVDLSELSARWDGFVGQLQAHDSALELQRQGLQQHLGKRFEDFCGTVAGFTSRWQGIRPRGGPTTNLAVVLVQLEDAGRQLADLQEEAQHLCKVGEGVVSASVRPACRTRTLAMTCPRLSALHSHTLASRSARRWV
jgi:hypothetical protein